MTKERGEKLANMFNDNYELAKKMGADNSKLALIVALLYTLDDMNQGDELKKGNKVPLEEAE